MITIIYTWLWYLEWMVISMEIFYVVMFFIAWLDLIALASITDDDAIPPSIMFGWIVGIFWPVYFGIRLLYPFMTRVMIPFYKKIYQKRQ